MSYEEFRKRVDTICNILVGAVPSPAGQIDQITYALIYKFMNDIDDRSAALGGKRTYFTGEYEKYNWHNLMSSQLGAHERLELYRQAIQTMAKNPNLPGLFREIYQNAFLPFNSPNVLNLFLKEIDKFSHDESDDIGDAYEYLLSKTGAQGDVGQFRTPRHIIKFIVETVNPTKDDSVLDPAVGTAGFLIAAYNHVKSQHDGKDEQGNTNEEQSLTADERAKLYKNYHGFDIDPTMVRTARVNMYLHGFTTPDIQNHDTLSSEDHWDKKYDVILANPPFMTPKGGIQPHKKFSISANRAEVLFVDYIASHINPVSGRAGIVVPEGVIFQSGKAYKELRKSLVENSLYAVVSLPAGVFNPYAGVKTSVLLLDKKLAKERDDILFVKVENDGYSLNAQRRPITGDQFPEALELIKKFQASEAIKSALAHTVPRSEIVESGDYNLSGDRYKTIASGSPDIQFVELGDIAEVYQPKTITSKEVEDKGTYPVFGANGIIGYYDQYNHENAEVAVTCRGATCGTVNYTKPKSWITGNAMVVSPKDISILNKRFLYYILRNDSIKNVVSGSAQPQITRSSLAPFKIPLPPIETQRQIVAELDGYQKIIDAAQTIVKTYKPTIKINPEWPIVKFGDKELFDIQSGGTPNSKEPSFWGGDINWATLVDLPAEDFVTEIIETKRKITQEGLAKSSAKLLPEGAVLVSSRATLGRVAIARGEVSTNQGFKNIVIQNRDKAIPEYVATIATTLKPTIESMASGGTFSEISKTSFESLEIPLPPIEAQRQIVAELEAEQKLVDANKKLIETFQQKIRTKIAEVWGE
ncbi:restriction endonuclease subunit S [Candidatus Saccharibacteria bacterium]|nr:restriction endonuclease subunit S [Candidatus Saccharibacteria bacterium]